MSDIVYLNEQIAQTESQLDQFVKAANQQISDAQANLAKLVEESKQQAAFTSGRISMLKELRDSLVAAAPAVDPAIDVPGAPVEELVPEGVG